MGFDDHARNACDTKWRLGLLINPIDYNGNVCGLDNTERNGMDMTNTNIYIPSTFVVEVCFNMLIFF